MKRAIAACAAAVLMTGTTYATVHSKQPQPRSEPVSLAQVGGLSHVTESDEETRALRASRSRSAAASVIHGTRPDLPRKRGVPGQTRSTPEHAKKSATRRAASAPSAGMWYRLVQCEASGHWDYGKPGRYIDRGYNFEGGPNFTHGTWVAYGGRQFAEHAYDATPAEQITVGERVLRRGWKGNPPQGPGAWPHCSYVAGMR